MTWWWDSWRTYGKVNVVNAYYRVLDNTIFFPAGFLQDVVFDKDKPGYVIHSCTIFQAIFSMTHHILSLWCIMWSINLTFRFQSVFPHQDSSLSLSPLNSQSLTPTPSKNFYLKYKKGSFRLFSTSITSGVSKRSLIIIFFSERTFILSSSLFCLFLSQILIS